MPQKAGQARASVCECVRVGGEARRESRRPYRLEPGVGGTLIMMSTLESIKANILISKRGIINDFIEVLDQNGRGGRGLLLLIVCY